MKKYGIYLIVILCGIAVFYLQFSYDHTYTPNSLYRVYLDNEQIGVIDSKDAFDKYVKNQGEIVKEQVLDYKRRNERIESVYEVFESTINYKNQYYAVYRTMVNNQSYLKTIYENTDNEGNIIAKKEDMVKYFVKLPEDIKGNSTISNYKITNYDSLISNLDNRISISQKLLLDYIYPYKDTLQISSGQKSMLEEYVNDYEFYKDITYSKYLYQLRYVDKYNIYLSASNIYEPLGIYIKKINTYDSKIDKVSDVYKKIIEIKPCTVEGYQFRIKGKSTKGINKNVLIGDITSTDYNVITDNSNDIIIYVTDKNIFESAVKDFITVFLGKDVYDAYSSKSQKEIVETGTYINNVYIDEDITVKKTNISIEERIFNDSNDLASYLLYGDDKNTKIVKAYSTDNITDFAVKNGISVEEFFLSNPNFNDINNMFYDGQDVVITRVAPKINVVVDELQVIDKTVSYSVIERYDSTLTIGSEYVEQTGVNGVTRVTQTVKKVNGYNYDVKLISNQTIKASRDKVILVGTKQVPYIGNKGSWGWPACKAYTISSGYGYRYLGSFGIGRELHTGIDISGCKDGSPILASNNGTIYKKSDTGNYAYGKSLIIDHNNGFCTVYAHLKGFGKGIQKGAVVERGQVIGYMGRSGYSTGVHLHFEIRVGGCGSNKNAVNPWYYLNKR